MYTHPSSANQRLFPAGRIAQQAVPFPRRTIMKANEEVNYDCTRTPT